VIGRYHGVVATRRDQFEALDNLRTVQSALVVRGILQYRGELERLTRGDMPITGRLRD
jgi:hypothetical protein